MQEKHKKAFSFPLLLFPSVIFHRANMYKTPLRRVDLQFHPPPPFFPQVIFFLIANMYNASLRRVDSQFHPPPPFFPEVIFFIANMYNAPLRRVDLAVRAGAPYRVGRRR